MQTKVACSRLLACVGISDRETGQCEDEGNVGACKLLLKYCATSFRYQEQSINRLT